MKIFLDTSDVGVIADYISTGLIDGITTNPSLMKKYGGDPVNTIGDICQLFKHKEDISISAEVVGETAEAMVSNAQIFIALDRKVTIKVPCTMEGLKACRLLSEQGHKVNVTLVFSVSQAVLAAKAGASYVSPFIGRVDDQRFNGLSLLQRIIDTFTRQTVTTKILAASIRSVDDVEIAFQQGADIVTMPPSIFEKMYQHILTDKGIEQFNTDWHALKK